MYHGSSFKYWDSLALPVCESEPIASMAYFLGVHTLGVLLGNGSELVKNNVSVSWVGTLNFCHAFIEEHLRSVCSSLPIDTKDS